MNNQKLSILVAPGLALLLLLSLRSVMALATTDTPTALSQAAIAVAKVPSEQAVLLGESATFTIFITNDGTTEAALTVEDPLGDSNCLTPPVNPLPAGDSTSYPCTTSDVAADFTNTIIVTGTYTDSTSLEASASAFVDAVDAAIDVTLSPPTQTVPFNGTALYSITVLNEGAVDLNLSAEALFGENGCQPVDNTPLGPGGTTTYDCTVPDVTADFTDVITVTGNYTSPSGTIEVSDSAQAFVDAIPLITVTKTADPETLPEPGGPVTFTVEIVNAGGDDVTLVALEDSAFGSLDDSNNPNVTNNDCPALVTIFTTTASMCSFQAEVMGSPGIHTNTVTATVEDANENQAMDSDNAAVTIEDVPSSILTTLTAAPTSVTAPGGNVTFTVKVRNTSAVDTVTIDTLTGDTPLDDLDGKGNCSVPQVLVAGELYECKVTLMVEGTAGQEKNVTVIAAGQDDDGVDVTDSSSPVKITFTVQPITKLFLPLAVNNFVRGEPNDTCAVAHSIAVNEDHHFSPDDVNDWYRFSLGSSGKLVIELTNFVPVQGQIILYKGNCGNLVIVKNNGNFLPTKTIEVESVDPGSYYVRVITDGPFSTTPYKLRVRFP